jgi:hypothetical protein
MHMVYIQLYGKAHIMDVDELPQVRYSPIHAAYATACVLALDRTLFAHQINGSSP